MLRKASVDPSFWNNNQKASAILKQISRLEKEIDLWSSLERRHGDVEVLLEFAETEETTLEEVEKELDDYQTIVEEVELKMILG